MANLSKSYQKSSLHSHWPQTMAYYASTFSLVSTTSPDGGVNLAPYQFSFPFGVEEEPSILLICRHNSNTAINLLKNGYATFNYIEHDESKIDGIISLGYPRLSVEKKRSVNPFTMLPALSGIHPSRVGEAFQVIEASRPEVIYSTTETCYIKVMIDSVYTDSSLGEDYEPRLPITLGYRGKNEFWFAAPGETIRRPVHRPTKRKV